MIVYGYDDGQPDTVDTANDVSLFVMSAVSVAVNATDE